MRGKAKWQHYWWQLMLLEDKGYEGWQPMRAARPLLQVPNSALATMSLAEWAQRVLEEAADELEEFQAEARVECFTEPDPAPDAIPVYSAQRRLGR